MVDFSIELTRVRYKEFIQHTVQRVFYKARAGIKSNKKWIVFGLFVILDVNAILFCLH